MASLLSYALCTVADVKEILGIDAGDTSKDNLIIRKINDATKRIENYTHRHFKSTTYTDEVYEGTGTDQLLLRNYPVTAFTTLSARDTSLNDNDFNTVDADQYFVDSNSGIVEAISSFYGGFGRWRVTYTAGYVPSGTWPDGLPDDVREACATLAAFLTTNSGVSSGQAVKRQTEGQRSIEYHDTSNSNKSIIESLGLDDVLDPYYNHVLSGQT